MNAKAALAAVSGSSCWQGTCHTGALNAAVAAKNPPNKKSGLDTPAKKSVQTAEETPKKEMLHMQHSTNYPATVRETGDMAEALGLPAPRLLEVLGPCQTPPAGFMPNYFVNEYAKNPQSELVDYSVPTIERPGYKILSSWTPEGGLRLYIDHDDNESFTVPEICDLISVLSVTLRTMVEEAHTPEDSNAALEGK